MQVRLLTIPILLTLLAGCGLEPRLSPAMSRTYANALQDWSDFERAYARQTKMALGARPEPAEAPARAASRSFAARAAAPKRVDLRAKMPPVYHQGPYRSCTAFAVAKGLGEFLLRRKGDRTPLSATHFYVATNHADEIAQSYKVPSGEGHNLVALIDDGGARISAAIATLEGGGAVAEADAPAYPAATTWPAYAESLGTATGPRGASNPMLGAFPRIYLEHGKGTSRVTYRGMPARVRLGEGAPVAGLAAIRGALADGWPVVAGFAVHESFYGPEAARTGDVPLPAAGERYVGGHAMVIVGYDDDAKRLLVRNSWGAGWGDGGHCRIPYAAVAKGQLRDCWTVGRE